MTTRGLGRTWPLIAALLGLGMLAWSGWRWADRETDSEGEFAEMDEPDDGALEDGHFVTVEAHEIPVFRAFEGLVKGEGTMEIRAPQGMVVAVEKIHKWVGEYVEKDEPLITFARDQFVRAIEEAEAAGRDNDAARFRDWMENYQVIRSPVEGQVLEVWAELGGVPFDKGIPLMTLTRRDSWSFVAQVPVELRETSAHIGAKVQVELEADVGIATGTVNTHGLAAVKMMDMPTEAADQGSAPGETESLPVTASHGEMTGMVTLVIGLEPLEGLEPDLRGKVRLLTGGQEVALVPKKAVEWRGDVAVVQVWEEDDATVGERTLSLAEEPREVGDFYVVMAGLHPGEHVVVPGTARD